MRVSNRNEGQTRVTNSTVPRQEVVARSRQAFVTDISDMTDRATRTRIDTRNHSGQKSLFLCLMELLNRGS